MIKGIPVKLYERTASGTDTFGHPIYTETPVTVEDVLVAPASTTEVLDMLNITGKKAVYNIAIPKGDTHDWQDCRVDFFGTSWRVIGLLSIHNNLFHRKMESEMDGGALWLKRKLS